MSSQAQVEQHLEINKITWPSETKPKVEKTGDNNRVQFWRE